jgi:hypothetical protein
MVYSSHVFFALPFVFVVLIGSSVIARMTPKVAVGMLIVVWLGWFVGSAFTCNCCGCAGGGGKA